MSQHERDGALPFMGLSIAQQHAWLAYMRVNLHLTYEMNHQLLADSELSLNDYHVLSKLSLARGRPLRISELAAEIGWERTRASHHLRRMKTRGLIEIQAAADDARAREIVATQHGRAAFRAAAPGHAALVRDLVFSELDADSVQALAGALEQIAHNIEDRGTLHGAMA
jgi:DNA-binding MarR family transcriptional regulator